MEKKIAQGLKELGLTGQVPEGAAGALARYGRELLEQNKVMNLTAIREEDGVARLHMLDCAALLTVPELDFAQNTLIDVGTGAGFPGLVLKLLAPTLEVTLLDSLQKRLDWLGRTAQALGLEGVQTLHARAEEAAHLPEYREGFDIATARAVAELRVLAELCLPYVKVGGLFLAMKAVDCAAELEDANRTIQALGGGVEALWDYAIPGTDVTHRIIAVRKLSPTPELYPRKWSKIRKGPGPVHGSKSTPQLKKLPLTTRKAVDIPPQC